MVTINQNIAWHTGLTGTLYSPGDGQQHPGILYLHGGQWKSATVTSQDQQAAGQMCMAGFVVFMPQYREAAPPTVGSTEQMADVRAALQWMHDNASQYKIDPTKIGAFGQSSGGNLAMVLASSGTVGADRADCAVSWSGPSDLPWTATEPGIGMTFTRAYTWIPCGDPGSPSPCIIFYDICRDYNYGLDLAGNEPLWQAASPWYLADTTCSPCQIWNSEAEVIHVSQATRFDEQLTALGVAHELHIVPGHGHALSYMSTALSPSITFFHQYLG